MALISLGVGVALRSWEEFFPDPEGQRKKEKEKKVRNLNFSNVYYHKWHLVSNKIYSKYEIQSCIILAPSGRVEYTHLHAAFDLPPWAAGIHDAMVQGKASL